jgi:hypothetical protein
MSHDKYAITTTFVVCDGTKDKALDEIRELLEHINKKSLDHVSDLKVVVTHEAVGE